MEGMRKTVVGAGVLSFVIGTILTILFMVFMKPLLILMNTPSDIFADAICIYYDRQWRNSCTDAL